MVESDKELPDGRKRHVRMDIHTQKKTPITQKTASVNVVSVGGFA